jgi:hypothetical protein
MRLQKLNLNTRFKNLEGFEIDQEEFVRFRDRRWKEMQEEATERNVEINNLYKEIHLLKQ